MEEANKVDAELVQFIENAMKTSSNSIEALDKVIEWKKKHRGLTGFHASPSLDVMCGTRKVDDPYAEAEKMAHDVLMMDLACAKGHCKDVTNEILQGNY